MSPDAAPENLPDARPVPGPVGFQVEWAGWFGKGPKGAGAVFDFSPRVGDPDGLKKAVEGKTYRFSGRNPTPREMRDAARVATALDNIQDATVSYRVASRLCKLLTKRGLPGVGQVVSVGKWLDEFGKLERLAASPWSFRKQTARRLNRRVPSKLKVRSLRARGMAMVPMAGDLLQVAQTTDDLFGIGLKLGPIFGFVNDVIFGSLMAWRGHPVEMRLPDGTVYDVVEDYANWYWKGAAKMGGGPLAPAWEAFDWVSARAGESAYGPLGPLLQSCDVSRGQGALGEGHFVPTNSDVNDAISVAQGVAASVLARAWDGAVGLLGAAGSMFDSSPAPSFAGAMSEEEELQFIQGLDVQAPKDWHTPAWLSPAVSSAVAGPVFDDQAEAIGRMHDAAPEIVGAVQESVVDGVQKMAPLLGMSVEVEPPAWARAAWWTVEQRREAPADADRADAVRYVEGAAVILETTGTGEAGARALDRLHVQVFGGVLQPGSAGMVPGEDRPVQ